MLDVLCGECVSDGNKKVGRERKEGGKGEGREGGKKEGGGGRVEGPGEVQTVCLGDSQGESQAMSSSVPPLSRCQVRIWILCIMKVRFPA